MVKKILIACESSDEYTAIHKSFSSGFLANGCDVTTFTAPQIFNKLLTRLYKKIDYLENLRQKTTSEKLIKKALSDSYDAIFIVKGDFLNIDTLKKIKQLRPNIKITCFNPDDPFNTRVCNNNCRELVNLCDVFFIWSKELTYILENKGVKKAIFLPFAVDSNLIYPIQNKNELIDIAFIGNGDEERNEFIAKLSNKLSQEKLFYKIHLFGIFWNLKASNIFQHNKRNSIDFLQTISNSKINLNLLRVQNKNSTNMRTFEIPAAGGFMLHENSDEAKEIFKPNMEAVYFSDEEDLVEKVKYYLNNDELRKKIALSGYKKANIYQNSYEYRCKVIIDNL